MISRKAWRWIEYMDNTRFLKSERKSGQLNLESLKSQFGLKENWQNATEITYISVELRLRRGHPEKHEMTANKNQSGKSRDFGIR